VSSVVTSWPIVSLFDFCNPKQWPTIPQTAFVEQGYPVYGANGKIGHYTEFNHEKPTVLITCRGATCGTINVCDPKSYVTGNAMALDDLDESRVSAEYLVYALRNGSLAQAISGTAQPQITRQSLTAISITLPPLAEQRRIAEVLDRAEALRAKRRAALAQLDSLTQSLFLDLFGDPATNPKGWPVTTLGDALVAIRNGANAEQRTEPGGWPITRIETIADGTINMQRVRWIEPDDSLTDGFQLQPGDILFSHINSVEHIAKTALYSGVPTPLIHGINLLRLRPKLDSVDPVWLLHLLKHDVVRTHFRTRCKRAVNQASLNQPDIKSLGTFLPPISLQREFARRVTAVEALKTAQRASLAELDALFATLQHRAFRGEL
jgi:type I restriction enzyme S subunit